MHNQLFKNDYPTSMEKNLNQQYANAIYSFYYTLTHR
jgi:hypothetical protein